MTNPPNSKPLRSSTSIGIPPWIGSSGPISSSTMVGPHALACEFWGPRPSDADAKACEALFGARHAPGTGQDKLNLWAGTLMSHGSPELKATFVRRLLVDEVAMCLLYSEPGAAPTSQGSYHRSP
ncbi:MAG: hypothetical protein R2706_12965 [Acidimicrobiales bacterium]